jgi:hypothetical protein
MTNRRTDEASSRAGPRAYPQRWPVAAIAAALLTTGCGGPAPSPWRGASRAASDGTMLVSHIVPPYETGPGIDPTLAGHYAWLDTSVPANHQLFVFMPATDGVPAHQQLLQKEAAHIGYHVVGLMYEDGFDLNGLCAGNLDLSSCFENASFSVVYGCRAQPCAGSVVSVSVNDSVVNLLTRLLGYLAQQYPDEGWADFLEGDEPNWSHVVVAGGSQGGANAAMIAKHTRWLPTCGRRAVTSTRIARHSVICAPRSTRTGIPCWHLLGSTC